MNIPVEAVKAAAMAIYQVNNFGESGYELGDYEPDARAALEASAPYMLATAWEQGRLAGSAGKVLDEEYPHLELTTNPYMLNNEGEK